NGQGNGQEEADETNNTRAEPTLIGPDWIVTTLSAPLESGAGLNITISATTKNQGPDGPASETFLFLSPGSTSPIAMATCTPTAPCRGKVQVPALGVNLSNKGTVTVTLPSDLAAGEYTITAKANGGGLPEADGTNNTKSRTILIGPDLTVPAISLSSTTG